MRNGCYLHFYLSNTGIFWNTHSFEKWRISIRYHLNIIICEAWSLNLVIGSLVLHATTMQHNFLVPGVSRFHILDAWFWFPDSVLGFTPSQKPKTSTDWVLGYTIIEIMKRWHYYTWIIKYYNLMCSLFNAPHSQAAILIKCEYRGSPQSPPPPRLLAPKFTKGFSWQPKSISAPFDTILFFFFLLCSVHKLSFSKLATIWSFVWPELYKILLY